MIISDGRKIKCYNQSVNPIYTGAIVIVKGKKITLASYTDTDSTKYPLGYVLETINPAGYGEVLVEGTVQNINTGSYSEGSILYLGTNGSMTPTVPTTQIILASISTSNALSGAIYFKVFTPAASTWGTIGGNLSDQDDLQTALDAKMDIATYDIDADGVVDSAEREQFQAKNGYGTTLTKGTIVYVKTSSSSAEYPEVLKANAGTETTSSKTIGAVYEDIAPGEIGYIVTSGRVHNLNTASYSVGAKLWLATTDGGVTTTPPTYPNHTVFIGHVTRSQNNNGGVLYAIQNGYELEELHNVVITSPVDDEVLTYEAGAWKNKPGGTGGVIPAGMTWMGAFPG